MSTKLLTSEEIYKLLEDVKDPEIDTVSILDLGMVEKVEVSGSGCLSQNTAYLSRLPGTVYHSKKCGNSY